MRPAIFTSRPYPHLVGPETVDAAHVLTGGRMYLAVYVEGAGATGDENHVTAGHALASGTLRPLVFGYDIVAELIAAGHALTDGTLRVVVLPMYTFYDDAAERVGAGHMLTEGTIRVVVLSYQNYAVEHVSAAHALTGGTLIVP